MFEIYVFTIRKDSGKYSSAKIARYYSWANTLSLRGTRLTLRGTIAHYHVKKFQDIKTVEQAEKKLHDLGFDIVEKKILRR